MKAQEFVSQLQQAEVVKAIKAAELKTSGEIRVVITQEPVETPVAAAQRVFRNAGMDQTRDHNGVLIFVAPRTRKFAVIGDIAVHSQCGDEFWLKLGEEMTGHFKKGEFTSGLIHAINMAGELLARHFPRKPDDVNELPDDIITE
jgi:uncharacterized membrane protein